MFSSIPDTLQLITIIVLGGFSFITLFDRSRKQNTKETIENFKSTIESMRLRMEEMDSELKEGRKAHQESLEKIAHLRGENETLKSLLLGKDPESLEYRQKSVELLQTLCSEIKNLDTFIRDHIAKRSNS